MKWIPNPEEDIYVAGITQTDIPDGKPLYVREVLDVKVDERESARRPGRFALMRRLRE